jgi:hypothetical protein
MAKSAQRFLVKMKFCNILYLVVGVLTLLCEARADSIVVPENIRSDPQATQELLGLLNETAADGALGEKAVSPLRKFIQSYPRAYSEL